MSHLYLIVVGVVCTVVVADAQSLSVQSKPARPHARVATVAGSALTSWGLASINFSNPYAPPVGTGKTAIGPFPAMLTDDPVEPKGGISLTADRDSPDDGRAEAPLLISTGGFISQIL
jgi:hypothetical protein